MRKKIWKRVIKVVVVILLILLVIALINFIRKKTAKKKTIDDFVDLKEVVEYTGSTYYKSTSSSEDGYEGDYYIRFAVDPIAEALPTTNKAKYERVILSIEEFLKYKNVRIIDEFRKLVVRTSCDKEKKAVSYTINGVEGYFEKRLARVQVEKNKEKISSFKITSPELNSIISSKWVRRNASLGTIDEHISDESSYDHYVDEGYSTRVLGTKIYNIIFNSEYKNEVVEGVKPGMKISEIVSILGEPTYKEVDSIDDCEYVGYKLSSCYVFFSDVISVYPVIEFDESKNNQFAEAMSEFKKNGSKSDLMKKVTEIYPNYNELTSITDGRNYTRIEYALYGFSIILGDNYNKIVIYSNYQGKIDNDTTVDELKQGLKSSTFIETKFHENALEYQEAERVEGSK